MLSSVPPAPGSPDRNGRLRLAAGALPVALASLALALMAMATPASATASNERVLPASALRALGLRPFPVSPGSAGRQLAAGLASRVLGPVDRALTEASAARDRGQQLRSDAFVLRSSSAAGRVLTSWRRAHRAQEAKVGSGAGIFVRRSHQRAVAQVLWRDGARLGLIVVSATRNAARSRDAAISDAMLADAFLITPLPTTPLERVLAQVRPDGTVSKATALEAFALVYGRVPGVEVPSGRRTPVLSATFAAQWVLRYRSQLTRAQLRRVDQLLGLPAPATAAATRAHAATLGDPGFHPNASLQAIATNWAGVEGGLLHHALGLKIVAGYTSTRLGTADAETLALNADAEYGEGDETLCRIRVPPKGRALSSAYLRFVIAHEVFHCFQFDLRRGPLQWSGQPAWILEGTAEWAALTVDPISYATVGNWLSKYIDFPRAPLFLRQNDAAGFFGHVQDVTHDLWDRFAAIFNTTGSDAAFVAAGGDTDLFLSTWGSSVFNQPPPNPAWEILSPRQHPPVPGATVEDVNPALGAHVFAAPYTVARYLVQATPRLALLHVVVGGHARLSRRRNYTDLGGVWFCTSSRPCVCPPNTIGQVPVTRPLTLPTELGVTGDPATGTNGLLMATSLDMFCRPEKGKAGSGGDPELFDFDGGVFGFQAAGEFTLLKSTRDDLQVQVRQQPFPGSRYVGENTAVALRVGSATVEIDAAGKSAIAAYVNKRRLDAPADRLTHVRLGAASLVVNGASAVVTWPDGSSVDVFNWLADANGQGVETPSGDRLVPALNLVVSLAPDRYRQMEGLLGNWGVPAAKEFVGRNGRAYPQSVITAGDVDVATPSELKVIYGKFGASWRVTQRESLFRYPRGKNTNSYTIRGFPRRYLTAASLPSGERAAGLAACRAAGITNARLLAACELDVGATGDKGFAIGDRRLQKAAGLPASAPGTPGTPSALHPVALATVTSDVSVPEVSYDPSSQDTYVAWLDGHYASVDVCVVTAAAPDCNGGAGPYRLVDSLAATGGAGAVYSDPRLAIEPGGTVVVVAGVDAASGAADPPGYGGAGVVAWSSPAGGAAFGSAGQGIADGGELLASSVGSGDMPAGGAIALDGTDIGVYGNDYPFASGFTDFTLSAPAPSPTPVPDSTGDFGQQLGINGTQLASVPDPAAPGEYVVVAVGGASGAPGCPAGSGDATGYGVAAGTAAGLQSQSAWGSQYFVPISCQASSPVLAGGGRAGATIGLLEDEGPGLAGSGADGVYFRRFDTTADVFGAPVLVSSETAQTLTGAEELDLSQDSAADDYATWADDRGTVLSYSSTAGASWRPPVAVPLPISPDDDVVVAGVGGGAAELAYTADSAAGQQLYLVPVSYSELTGT